ncbi:glycosyltransferase family 2 protein [Roseovarius salinarum]|uniref:glycosyltransferase family 2 protein n=1 Tax=Roseovarius salinarum TaxID=1981892 RepID=UPI000C31E93E|nr:glycosyltransferase [Roseovarius salinarum]
MNGAIAPAATVIVPAHDEAEFIAPCLAALLASDIAAPVEVIVVANGCTDDTARIAKGFHAPAETRNWRLQVLEREQGDKLRALQAGDDAAAAPVRIYLDADTRVSAGLLGELIAALDSPGPRYASGRPRVAPARSPATRAYARFWQRLPFFRAPAPGFGIYAVNAAGRARWDRWPAIISDDTFARMNFAPEERVAVGAPYDWPMVEGFGPLVRVRRRQDAGVREIAQRFPDLAKNADPSARSAKLRAALHDPIGFAVYAGVALCVRLPLGRGGWARGRGPA